MSGWTEKAIAILRDGTAASLTNGQMAARIRAETGWNVTRNAVIGKRSRMGITLTPEQVAETNRILSLQASERTARKRQAAEQREAVKRARTAEAQWKAAESERRKMRARLALVEPFKLVDTARPLLTRRMGEDCAWPIEDGSLSCCAPITRGAYCDHHAAIGYVATSSASDLARSLRRYAA